MTEKSTDEALFVLYKEIAGKLDTVITGQSNLSTRMESVECQVSELHRTVRGFNGTPGLVTEFALLKARLEHPSSLNVDKPASNDDQGDKEDEDGSITFKWIVDKAFMPVFTAILLYILLEVVPVIAAKGGTP